MDLTPGDRLTLEGVSLKGKNRIRELGDKWVVVQTATPREWLKDRVAITPVATPKFPYIRFIHPTRDEHFKILAVSKGDEGS